MGINLLARWVSRRAPYHNGWILAHGRVGGGGLVLWMGDRKMIPTPWPPCVKLSTTASTGSIRRRSYGLGHSEEVCRGALLRDLPSSIRPVCVHKNAASFGIATIL